MKTNGRQQPVERRPLVDKALRDSSVKLIKPELRQILVIAALTPAEYETVDLEEGLRSR